MGVSAGSTATQKTTPSTQRMLGAERCRWRGAVTEEQTEGRGRLGRRWEARRRSSILVSPARSPRSKRRDCPSSATRRRRRRRPGDRRDHRHRAGDQVPERPADRQPQGRGDPRRVDRGPRSARGIGVNATAQEELPADTLTPPTSLRVVLGEPVDRARLLAAILFAPRARRRRLHDGYPCSVRPRSPRRRR